MPRLPKDDEKGLRFITDHFAKFGKAPSFQAIADHMDYVSKRSVQLMLERLQTDGRIIYELGKISLVHTRLSELGEQTVTVPILGRVPCGSFDLAEEIFEDQLEVSTQLARPGNQYFVLRAKGDSMNLSGIEDGDLCLIRKQPAANDGERVVGVVNGQATIKHFHREKDVVVLRPNSTDKSIGPIYLSEEFAIIGVVIATLPNP